MSALTPDSISDNISDMSDQDQVITPDVQIVPLWDNGLPRELPIKTVTQRSTVHSHLSEILVLLLEAQDLIDVAEVSGKDALSINVCEYVMDFMDKVREDVLYAQWRLRDEPEGVVYNPN